MRRADRLPGRFPLAVSCACATGIASFGWNEARCDEPSAVSLRVPDCEGTRGTDVRRLASIELAPLFRLSGEDVSAIQATVECGDGLAVISVTDTERDAPLRLEVNLRETSERSRARLLALAIAELIATSRLERTERGRRAVEPMKKEPGPAPTKPAEDSLWRLWLAPGASRLGQPGITMLGGEVGGSRRLGPVALGADVQARFGGNDVDSAKISVRTVSASLAIGPWLSYRSVDLTVGPGFRVGSARLTGRSDEPDVDGRSLSGLWFGPTAGLSAHVGLSSWASLRTALEAGYVLSPVRGFDEQSRRLLALEGPWASAAMGAAVQW